MHACMYFAVLRCLATVRQNAFLEALQDTAAAHEMHISHCFALLDCVRMWLQYAIHARAATLLKIRQVPALTILSQHCCSHDQQRACKRQGMLVRHATTNDTCQTKLLRGCTGRHTGMHPPCSTAHTLVELTRSSMAGQACACACIGMTHAASSRCCTVLYAPVHPELFCTCSCCPATP
jgi:hypothetical protein